MFRHLRRPFAGGLKPRRPFTRSKPVMAFPALILPAASGAGAALLPCVPAMADRVLDLGPLLAALGRPDAATIAPSARAEAARRERVASDPEELAWIERARTGDEPAFRRLVERHGDRAYSLALRIVRDAGEAEEVAQDAFVRAWRALPGFRGDAAFSTWLHRIVVRRALDRARVLRGRRARETDAMPEALPDPAPAPEHDLEARAARRRLERLIGALPASQRAAITLYYFHDRSVLEVAAILGLPENTVKTHLSRARLSLRGAWLGEEGEA